MKKVLLIISILMFTCACDKIKVKEKLDFEVNSELKISDLVEEDENITLLEPKELVDTSALGKHKVIIKYLNKRDKDKYKTITISIVDTIPPIIKCKDTISTVVGKDINILKHISVSDNSKEEIKLEVLGNYDVKKVGKYKLTISAKDSSGNKSTKDIIYEVKYPTIKTSGYYVHKEKNYWEGTKFKKGGKVQEDLITCPGGGCGIYTELGTYKIKDNKITIKITSYMDESGGGKTSRTEKCTIKSEEKIVCGKYTYTWAKKFY